MGIATECDVYLNGVWLYHNETQYTPINVDITDFIKFDGQDNVVAVHVTQKTIENWWYNGGGICHKAYITVFPPVSLERDGVWISPALTARGEWSVSVSAEVHNAQYTDASVRVTCELLNAESNLLATAEVNAVVPAREISNLKLPSITVSNPHLWDIDDPYLHRARTRVYVDGKITDEKYDYFGFRTVEFTVDKGFLLNGKQRYINGICGHEDFGLTGKPYALKLRYENEDDVCANGEDLALFTCYVVDEEGIEVPDAECEVTLIPDKDVKLVGTGSDHSDHTPPASPTRRMYAGRVLVALLPMSAGKMTLRARSYGLKTASITVEIPEDRNPVPGRVYPMANMKW